SAEKETAPLIVNLKNKKKEEAAVETFAENWVANHHSAPACTNAAYSLKQLEINAAAKKGAPGRLMHKDGDLNKAITSVSTESKKLTIAVKKEVKEFNVEGFCKSLDKITTTLLPKARNILDVKAPDLVNSTIENTNKWYTEIRSFKDHCCNASVGGGIQYSVLGHEFGFKDYVQVRPFLEAKINTAADDVTYSSNQVEKGDGYATKAANGTQYADNTFQEHSAIFPGMKSWSEYKDLISAANDLDTAAGEVKTGANDLSKAAGKAKKAANLAHEGTKEMDKVCNKLLPEEERLVVSFCDKALGAKTKKTGSIPKGRKSYDNVLGDIKTGLKNANSEIKKNWSWLQYVYDPPKPPLYQQTKPMTLAQICAKQKTPVIMPSPPLAGLELVPISSLHFTTQGCPTAPPAKK
ncbi:MAG: hypothetical protein HOK20_05395, partial [Alphaproteobacteria bacterium]|nr:hypothetical protein [Alphaproteobacteria bacterium]